MATGHRLFTRRTEIFILVGVVLCIVLQYKYTWLRFNFTTVAAPRTDQARATGIEPDKLQVTVRRFEEPVEEKWKNKTKIHITERRFTAAPRTDQASATGIEPDKLQVTVRRFEEPLEEKWTNKTKIHITERRFTASENGRVFILGVVAKNSTPAAHWDEFAVYGQWYDVVTLNESSILCCFKNDDDQIIQKKPIMFNVRNYRQWSNTITSAPLPLWHITCRKPSFDPRWVSIARNSSCSSGHVTYPEPYYAMKQPDGHHVITTKFAYGGINPHTVVSFLETMKYFGIDKVVTYVHPTLNSVVKSVLSYYSHQGLLDYYTLELADAKKVQHKFANGIFTKQYHSDEWLVKKDALERNIGSTYFGIFDMDEFLIPSGNRSYKRLMNDLRRSFPNASHFFFKNVHYLVEQRMPDELCAPNCTVFKRFLHTSPLRFNSKHEKMFLLTDRVLTQSLDNHYVKSLPGYTRITCPETEAYVRHYGGCRRKFTNAVCDRKQSWVEDRSMKDWAAKTVDAKIKEAIQLLGLPNL